MEFECKRLEQRLDTLKREKKLKSWTEHNNEFGTVITIRCSHMKPKPHNNTRAQEDYQTSASSSGDHSQIGVKGSPSSESKQNNNTREHHTDSVSPINAKKVYKPASQYQINRDRERREAFKIRCTTRSKSSQNSDVPKQSESVEQKRAVSQSDYLDSSGCISPSSVASCMSPWADKNPYSCLELDSDVDLETVSELQINDKIDDNISTPDDIPGASNLEISDNIDLYSAADRDEKSVTVTDSSVSVEEKVPVLEETSQESLVATPESCKYVGSILHRPIGGDR